MANATRIARSMPDPTGAMVIDWLIAIDGTTGAGSVRIAEAIDALDGWPGQSLMTIRFEQALLREEPDAATAIAELDGRTPVLEPTTLLLARSYLAMDRRADAVALIASTWRNRNLLGGDGGDDPRRVP